MPVFGKVDGSDFKPLIRIESVMQVGELRGSGFGFFVLLYKVFESSKTRILNIQSNLTKAYFTPNM